MFLNTIVLEIWFSEIDFVTLQHRYIVSGISTDWSYVANEVKIIERHYDNYYTLLLLLSRFTNNDKEGEASACLLSILMTQSLSLSVEHRSASAGSQ